MGDAFVDLTQDQINDYVNRMNPLHALPEAMQRELIEAVREIRLHFDQRIRNEVGGGSHWNAIRALSEVVNVEYEGAQHQFAAEEFFGINRHLTDRYPDLADVRWFALYSNSNWELERRGRRGEHLTTGFQGIGDLGAFLIQVNGIFLSAEETLSFYRTIRKRGDDSYRGINGREIRRQLENPLQVQEDLRDGLVRMGLLSNEGELTYIGRSMFSRQTATRRRDVIESFRAGEMLQQDTPFLNIEGLDQFYDSLESASVAYDKMADLAFISIGGLQYHEFRGIVPEQRNSHAEISHLEWKEEGIAVRNETTDATLGKIRNPLLYALLKEWGDLFSVRGYDQEVTERLLFLHVQRVLGQGQLSESVRQYQSDHRDSLIDLLYSSIHFGNEGIPQDIKMPAENGPERLAYDFLMANMEQREDGTRAVAARNVNLDSITRRLPFRLVDSRDDARPDYYEQIHSEILRSGLPLNYQAFQDFFSQIDDAYVKIDFKAGEVLVTDIVTGTQVGQFTNPALNILFSEEKSLFLLRSTDRTRLEAEILAYAKENIKEDERERRFTEYAGQHQMVFADMLFYAIHFGEQGIVLSEKPQSPGIEQFCHVALKHNIDTPQDHAERRIRVTNNALRTMDGFRDPDFRFFSNAEDAITYYYDRMLGSLLYRDMPSNYRAFTEFLERINPTPFTYPTNGRKVKDPEDWHIQNMDPLILKIINNLDVDLVSIGNSGNPGYLVLEHINNHHAEHYRIFMDYLEKEGTGMDALFYAVHFDITPKQLKNIKTRVKNLPYERTQASVNDRIAYQLVLAMERKNIEAEEDNHFRMYSSLNLDHGKLFLTREDAENHYIEEAKNEHLKEGIRQSVNSFRESFADKTPPDISWLVCDGKSITFVGDEGDKKYQLMPVLHHMMSKEEGTFYTFSEGGLNEAVTGYLREHTDHFDRFMAYDNLSFSDLTYYLCNFSMRDEERGLLKERVMSTPLSAEPCIDNLLRIEHGNLDSFMKLMDKYELPKSDVLYDREGKRSVIQREQQGGYSISDDQGVSSYEIRVETASQAYAEIVNDVIGFVNNFLNRRIGPDGEVMLHPFMSRSGEFKGIGYLEIICHSNENITDDQKELVKAIAKLAYHISNPSPEQYIAFAQQDTEIKPGDRWRCPNSEFLEHQLREILAEIREDDP